MRSAAGVDATVWSEPLSHSLSQNQRVSAGVYGGIDALIRLKLTRTSVGERLALASGANGHGFESRLAHGM